MSGWPNVALKDVAQIERDVIDASGIQDGTLYVGLENIQSGGDLVGVRPVATGELTSSKFAFSPRHLLFGKLRPYLAKVARPQFSGVCSTDILPVLPGPKLDRNYLAHFLLTPNMVALVSSRATGANLPRLSPSALGELKVPLPPLSEQRRIAEVLDGAEALRAKRRTALAQLDTLIQAFFVDMFGDPATNPKGWPVLSLEEVAATTSGGTPSRDEADYFGGPIPWVKSGELHQGVITQTEESLTERGIAESSAKVMPIGTVLVAMYGATVGAVAVLGIEAATNQAICCIQPSDALNAVYLVHLLRRLSPSLLAKRVGGAQPNLSQELLRRLRLPVPPIKHQCEFAGRVAVIEQLKNSNRTSSAELDALFASLQHRAFRGEL